MTIEFLFGRREALVSKSQKYKVFVRNYLESLGFSQTTDSFIEGTLADMVFYNPIIAPGKQFIIEVKADELTVKSKNLARELVQYFRIWQNQDPDRRFEFWLFIQGIKRAEEWEAMFSQVNDIEKISEWCVWYNEKCLKKSESGLEGDEVNDIASFFSQSTIKVANSLELELATIDKKTTSLSQISRYGKKLEEIVNKRRSPIGRKSNFILFGYRGIIYI